MLQLDRLRESFTPFSPYGLRNPTTSILLNNLAAELHKLFLSVRARFNTCPMSKKESQPDLPEPNVRSLNKGSKLDASNTYADTYRRFRVPVPPWKPPGLSLFSLFKRNEVRTPTEHPSCIAGQSQQSKPTQLSKDHADAVSIKGEIRENVGNRGPPAVPIRVKAIQKSAVPKDPVVPTQSKVVQETAITNDPAVPIPKTKTKKAAIPKDAPVSTQRTGVLESSVPKHPAVPIQRRGTQRTVSPKAPPVPIMSSGIKNSLAPKTHAPSSRSGTTKTSAPRQVSHEKTDKTQLSPSQSEPVHHIKWDGMPNYISSLDEECEPLGQTCFLCDKDFSRAPKGVDRSNYEDRFENHDAPKPRMLPAVDILPCGHAFHSECLQFAITEEQFSDPPCILCLISVA